MKKITVFTPTYNRAYCLPQLYMSLCRQDSEDFEWLVVDDGSTDNTAELVQQWKNEKKIPITYLYKENGGMHTAHNTALKNISTELNVCIDSDDYLAENAIQSILNCWDKNKESKYAGIVGLNAYKNGKTVSNKPFPSGIKSGKYAQLKNKYGLVGDVKFVYSTEVIKKYAEYPVFPNENFTPLGYKYAIIDQDYDLLFLNEKLCVVEYMEDGSTKNIFRQYFKNPKGFAYSRKMSFIPLYTNKEQYINAVHLVAESFLARQNPFRENPEKWLTFLALPVGILLYFYILYLNRK